VPNEKHTILFEPSNQLDPTTRKYGGTGLGLALANGSATMGGQCGTDNAEGGSTFHFFVTLQLSP
jgi:signal transduction histidine kinase